MNRIRKLCLAAAIATPFLWQAAAAGPWAEVGDTALRSDILMLTSAGVIDDVTMQWPLPWSSLMQQLKNSQALSGQDAGVRAAAARVLARAERETRQGGSTAMRLEASSEPALVRGFAQTAQGTVQGQASFGYLWGGTALNLAVGGKTLFGTDRQALMLDGSYLAQQLGPVEIYAGYKTHWWGPGWVSALSLSNNARPMPQIGLTRAHTDAFESPWLSWLGPWQAEFLVGLLDGPRDAENTVYTAFRFAFHPLQHLEIGLARTTELCGKGHPCQPLSDYFSISNDKKNTNRTNDQGNIDIRYSDTLAGLPFETYVQFMNEDTNPIQHSDSSHLVGASLWLPIDAGTYRFTVEYADTVATKDLWGSGTVPGFTYNNWSYSDGMRYRGRALGASLDSDSRLLSVQAGYTAQSGNAYTFSYHHAEIGTQATPTPPSSWSNRVSASPVVVNLIEGRMEIPFHFGDSDVSAGLTGRVQDNQPRPHDGWLASVEASLTLRP